MVVAQITRQSFDAAFPVESQILEIPSVRRMSLMQQRGMLDRFDAHGFVILRCLDLSDSYQDLLGLGRYFGNPAPHPRADDQGIVGINAFKRTAGFLGSTPAEHLLHTDGAFRDAPEKIITLQCVTPAAIGGMTILASAQAAYDHVARVFPDKIELLSRADALTVTRTSQSSTQAVFTCSGEWRGIKFRMRDGAAEVAPHADAQEIFEELCRFFEAPENRFQFRLEAGDILIADNTAIVHGRTSFAPHEPRNMRRLNFDATGPACARMIFGFLPSVSSEAGSEAWLDR
ncbi:TauD/TfdA family dioxygenase [Streptomyces sp. NPDC050636]|uniref:TauD/TfdA family dioxygenase n=1 Tax=Streptomyces sp. NPDC050636 TaxID=3154510 RepID=UPI00343AE3B3